MTVLPLAANPSVGVESLDAEHRVQLGLITALQQALEQGGERAVVDEILDQLVAYTNAHFMSEQLRTLTLPLGTPTACPSGADHFLSH